MIPPPNPAVLLSTTETPFWTAVNIFARACKRTLLKIRESHLNRHHLPVSVMTVNCQAFQRHLAGDHTTIQHSVALWIMKVAYVICHVYQRLCKTTTSLITASNIAAVDPGVPTPGVLFGDGYRPMWSYLLCPQGLSHNIPFSSFQLQHLQPVFISVKEQHLGWFC